MSDAFTVDDLRRAAELLEKSSAPRFEDHYCIHINWRNHQAILLWKSGHCGTCGFKSRGLHLCPRGDHERRMRRDYLVSLHLRRGVR